jgi:NTE family protein
VKSAKAKIKPKSEFNITRSDCRIGLVLPGGGARGAYQVGVLKAIAEMLPRRATNPFAVVSGTSAGAINSTVIASRAQLFHVGVAELENVWSNFRSHHVFRTDNWTMIRNGSHWLFALIAGGWVASNPISLLDNTPLRNMLRKRINFASVQKSIDKGHVDSVAITAAGYTSARSVSFFQGGDGYSPWQRIRRSGRPAEIALDHLMASIAVPIVFPPVKIDHEFFGDGAMRQATPLSPAVHLGADRILVIGARNEVHDPEPDEKQEPVYPSLGTVAGYMLDALFMDGLSVDLERLTRINLILDQVPGRSVEGEYGDLRPIDVLVMLPSEDIREIAERHVHELPRSFRILLKGLGALNKGGMQLASYLLFERGYTRALIDMGYRDAMARRSEIESFLSGEALDTPARVSGWRDLIEEYTVRLPVLKLSRKK